MKYLAILKDSLRETIDSKVFFVTLGISLVAVVLLATLRLEADPPNVGLERIASRFPTGIEAEAGVLGKIRISDQWVEFRVDDLRNLNEARKPWDAEYNFTLVATDHIPYGFRSVVLYQMMQAEEEQERAAPTGRKTRMRKLGEETNEEVERLKAQNKQDGNDNRRLQQDLMKFMQRRLEEEAQALSKQELEGFLRQQLESQANWSVDEVSQRPPEKIKINLRTTTTDGNDSKTSTKEVEGEANRFAITVKSRSGTFRVWPHKATLFFGGIPLGSDQRPGKVVYNIEKYLACSIGASVIMLLSCIITAFYIPNMLRKGTIDLLLAKPISRGGLLLYKYIGGLTFMLVNTIVMVGGFWVVIGVRSGIWDLNFLLLILILTYEFALFYALSTLGAVLTRSPIVSILLCVVLWGLLFGMSWGYWIINQLRPPPGSSAETVVPTWLITTTDVAHAVLPHYGDLDSLGSKALYISLLEPSDAELKKVEVEYEHYRWGESLAVTTAYILAMLGLAYWRFGTKDY